MRISDWSSDVCSSVLAEDHGRDGPRDREAPPRGGALAARARRQVRGAGAGRRRHADLQVRGPAGRSPVRQDRHLHAEAGGRRRSEEHTSELQSLMRISYAVFCLKKKKKTNRDDKVNTHDTTKNINIHNKRTK